MRQLAVIVAIVAAGLGFLTVSNALADDCVALGGTIVGAECQISVNVGAKSGTFNLDETLHILSTGKITVPALAGGNTLTLNICTLPTPCDLIMDTGAQIKGDVTGAGATGATITVNATHNITLHGTGASGAAITSNQSAGSCSGGKGGTINLIAEVDILAEVGTLIQANGTPCPAGAITLISAQNSITVLGTIESVSTNSGTGATQRPGGGPINIIARCNLTVGGLVRSHGGDPGADLVHLEGGCLVVINGVVESTGSPGHTIPNNPPNHCNNSNRPDKPTNSTACIEVWAGDGLTINTTAELNADTGGAGGLNGTGWIDLFARGPIIINGDTNTPFAVHANGLGAGDIGGLVTVKTTQSTLTASGLALQASAGSGATSHGGQITAEAASHVTLDTATLEAKAIGVGGTIGVRSFTGALSWQNGVGDVRPVATGTISLTACSTVTTTGTNFNGTVPAVTTGVCSPAAPTLPSYVVLPTCICGNIPGGGGECPEDPHRIITRSVDPTGTTHGLIPNHLTLGGAVSNASTVEIIGVFGRTTENVTISTKKLIVTQCTVAQITAADNTKAVIHILSGDPTTIVSLDTVGGTVGLLVQSNNNDIKSVRASGASQYGILVKGNTNKVSWNQITQNTLAGIRVEGNTNNLRGGTVDFNAGDGVQLGTTATGNTFQGAYVQSNGGNGIVVEGNSNKILSNSRVDLNTLNGILVTGNTNTIKGNGAGSSAGLGNGQDGIHVTGTGNVLDSNKVSANGGDGIDVSGGSGSTGNKLRGNQSNLSNSGGTKENAGAEFRLLGTVTNLGGNKADGIGVPKVTAPQKCPTFPGVGATVTFATQNVCE